MVTRRMAVTISQGTTNPASGPPKSSLVKRFRASANPRIVPDRTPIPTTKVVSIMKERETSERW